MKDSALIRYFDQLDRTDLLFINFAFLIVIIPGISFGLATKNTWMLYVGLVLLPVFVLWNILYFYVSYKMNKEEKKLLQTLPSFPQQDFCDFCGKTLEETAPSVIEDKLIILCPHCGKENVVKSEEEIEKNIQNEIAE